MRNYFLLVEPKVKGLVLFKFMSGIGSQMLPHVGKRLFSDSRWLSKSYDTGLLINSAQILLDR